MQQTTWRTKTSLLALAVCLLATGPAFGGNKPCSQSKGGVVGCQNGKYLCRDGSISASKKRCGGGGAGATSQDQAIRKPKDVAKPPK